MLSKCEKMLLKWLCGNAKDKREEPLNAEKRASYKLHMCHGMKNAETELDLQLRLTNNNGKAEKKSANRHIVWVFGVFA